MDNKEHDTDLMLFAFLTDAQNILNRALTYSFQVNGSIDSTLFNLHKSVAVKADEYRQRLIKENEVNNL